MSIISVKVKKDVSIISLQTVKKIGVLSLKISLKSEKLKLSDVSIISEPSFIFTLIHEKYLIVIFKYALDPLQYNCIQKVVLLKLQSIKLLSLYSIRNHLIQNLSLLLKWKDLPFEKLFYI